MAMVNLSVTLITADVVLIEPISATPRHLVDPEGTTVSFQGDLEGARRRVPLLVGPNLNLFKGNQHAA